MALTFVPFSGPAAAADAPVRFGMDMASITAQTNAGVKPDYAMFWVGVWNQKSGWGGPDADLDKAYAAGVTPVIQFYYWGDDISVSCLENGCYSTLHDAQKTKAGWQSLAVDLVTHLNGHMKGREAVIILETEFNKGGVATYDPLDGYLRDKANHFHAGYPAAKVVLGLGNWGSDSWGTWDRAAAASDSIGLQGLRGSTRDSLATYLALPNALLAGATKARSLFAKPVFIDDVALSTYPEPTYLDHQATVIGSLFSRMDELKAAGVTALMYRSWKDSPTMDLANYYGEAERHWGVAWATNSVWKPAAQTWVDGVKAERATTPPPPPPVCSDGADNDADGKTDYPADPGCTGTTDTDEYNAPPAVCADGVDNDGDGKTDHPNDPGCTSTADTDEYNAPPPTCSDGIDNDADGKTDHPADPGCASATDTDEYDAPPAACADGIDNDADGKTDYPDDPGCGSATDGDEYNAPPPPPTVTVSATAKTRVEGEDFGTKSTGGLQTDAAASAGEAWNVWSTGQIDQKLSFGTNGKYDLTVRARGTSAGGVWPHMVVRLDGVAVDAADPTGAYGVYTTRLNVGAGTHTLTVSFTNDAIVNGQDRNLIVDYGELAPVVRGKH